MAAISATQFANDLAGLINQRVSGALNDNQLKGQIVSLYSQAALSTDNLALRVSEMTEGVKGRMLFGPEGLIASAANVDLGLAPSHLIRMTGSVDITSFGFSASSSNPVYFVISQDGHNVLPGPNLKTPGDDPLFIPAGTSYGVHYEGAGVWRVLWFPGAPGTPGAAGSQGPQGIQGIQGNPGSPGAPATVGIGSVTTGAPGSQATVQNTGTSSAAILAFSIPQGPQGNQGIQGTQGPAGSVAVGTVSTGAPGSQASVSNGGSSAAAVLNFVIPQGPQGLQGLQGNQGAAATLALGTVSTGAAGTNVIISNSGNANAATFNFTIPRGEQGLQGIQGNQGIQGPAGPPTRAYMQDTEPTVGVQPGDFWVDTTNFQLYARYQDADGLQWVGMTYLFEGGAGLEDFDIGTVTTLAAGAQATATLTGTLTAPILNLGIPAGAQGLQGIQGIQGNPGNAGAAATVSVGTVTGLAAGASPTVTNVGSTAAAIFNFGIPAGAQGLQGIQGIQGDPGAAATISVGTVTGLAAGASPTVTNVGSTAAAVFNFGIPAGAQGIQGIQGNAATVVVGTVTTGAAGTNAIVTNAGSSSAAQLNFTIPRGDPGTSTPNFFKILAADAAGQNVNTVQPWFPAAGGVTLAGDTTYMFEGEIQLARTAGSTSHTIAVLFGGTAVLASIGYTALARSASGNVLGTVNVIRGDSAAAVTISGASTSTTENNYIRVVGTVRVTTGGTFIPQFQFSAAPGQAPTIKANSTFFTLWAVGAAAATSQGTWA